MMYFKFEFSLGKGKKQAATKKEKKVLGWKIVHSQVEMLKKEEKFKTASNYLTAARSWTKFLQREDWTFSEMDSQEVELYQRWLSDKGICLNTISAYLRSLRAMYNRWAEEYSSNDDVCPFTKAFTGKTKTAKRSITESEIRKLHDLDLEEGSTLAMSRDIFIFSFYAMGMPFVDIAYLKKSQMKDNVIRYARHKTGQPISIALVPAMQAIISRYSSSDSIYVFPLLTTQSPDLLHREYLRRLRQYNYSLHVLSKKISSSIPLSSYVVRHSWASIAYQHNMDIGLIGKALGHTKTSTTFVYIKSLFDSNLASANQSLMQDIGI